MHHEMHIIESVRVTELSPSLMKVHYGSLHILLNKANSFCPSRSINFSLPSVQPAISSVNIASSGGFQQQKGFRKLGGGRCQWCAGVCLLCMVRADGKTLRREPSDGAQRFCL